MATTATTVPTIWTTSGSTLSHATTTIVNLPASFSSSDSMPNWISTGTWDDSSTSMSTSVIAPTLESSPTPASTVAAAADGSSGGGSGIRLGAIIGLIVAVVVLLIGGLVGGIWMVRRERRKKEEARRNVMQQPQPQQRGNRHGWSDTVGVGNGVGRNEAIVPMTDLTKDGTSIRTQSRRGLSRSSSVTSFEARQVEEGHWKAVEGRSVV